MSGPAQNTDRELWRERPDDYYADSVHVTAAGGIGINCGGTVIVKPLREWHCLAARVRELEADRAEGIQRTSMAVIRIAALKEENRRLREEIISKNEELHELELEMREEWPE